MFEYKIVKKGRKWFEATDIVKGWKAQIEINEISQGWNEGEVVKFDGKKEFKSSGGFTKVFLFPMTSEGVEQVEIERWLKLVEEADYLYKNGIEKLRAMNLNEQQKARLDKVIRDFAVGKILGRLNRYFDYISEKISETYWYSNGEVTVLECIEELKKFNIDTAKYETKLEKLKAKFEEAQKQAEIRKVEAEKVYLQRHFFIQLPYKRAYNIGDIVVSNGKIGRVSKIKAVAVYDELDPDFDEERTQWEYRFEVDTQASIPDDVKEEYLKKDAEKRARLEAERQEELEQRRKIKEFNEIYCALSRYIKGKGEYPTANERIIIKGEEIYNNENIYGGGGTLVLDEDDKTVWESSRNGMDGDDWSWNNTNYGWSNCMIMDDFCEESIEKIRQLLTEIKDKERLR